ncbi:MAG TPA: hypothetical protein VJU85_08335 [Nitrososphaeraceae archaeon]|nr:hypothetical protein [Nitrososphaeraceae archaeon]
MNKLINYSLSLLSYIIGGVFIFITLPGYQSYSAQEGGEEISGINKEEKEEESNNDIFSDLSRNLPRIEEDIPDDNKESQDSEIPIFENQDTKDLDDNNKISSRKNLVESNDQGASSESIERSFTNGFSDSGEESDIIKEEDGSSNTESSSSSSSNSMSNDDAVDKNIVNR